MNTRKHLFALSSGLLLSVAGVVNAETTTGETAKGSTIAALEARIAELEGQKSQTWLNERRAEEVKALVREVLADADTRASLQGSGAVAGHNGKNFFLASEDGNFLLTVGGQIQVRYVYNNRDESETVVFDEDEDEFVSVPEDDNENGFTIRRAKVNFQGHIGSPKIQYQVRLAANRDTETVRTDVVKIGYQLTDNISVWVGEDKAPFMREELISSGAQLAVERSYFNETFTLGYVQGAWVNWDITDMIKASMIVHDGSRSGEDSSKDFANDNTDVALGGRVDVKLMGDWASAKDFSSWSGEDSSLIVGTAINWDLDESGDARDNGDVFSWTLDAGFKAAGFNLYAAYAWQSQNDRNSFINEDDEIVDDDNVEIHGYMVQAGYMVIPDKLEPYVRYEWVEFDDPFVTNDEVNMITVGGNYYINKHNAKFTLDVVFVMDPLDASNTALSGTTGMGLLTDSSNDDQMVVRAQFQLLF